jgi:NTP pyrophosphatase (non-canonical NTP hydrolase)
MIENMGKFTVDEMLEMQRMLQEKYKDKWEGISPEVGKNKLLWMVGEIGEAIDIVKKHGGGKASSDAKIRPQLIEELTEELTEELELLAFRQTCWPLF